MVKKIPASVKRSVRFAAMETIERVEKGGAYSNLLLNEMMNRSSLNDKDRRLFTELVYGTISHKLLLEFYLQPFIQKAKKVDSWVKNLLLLSLYQLNYLDKVPDHAIINEAVEIAKGKGNVGIGKFVNGILRSYQRQGAPALSQIKDPIERLSVEISLPVWLVQRLISQLGVEETRKLGLSLYEKSHVSGRIDTRFVHREQAIEQLQEDGIEARKSEISPYGVIADKGFLAGSSLFEEGKLTIQDESSMLVAPAMLIEEQHQVLDACAAPGGKTAHIATFLDAKKGGKVVSLDIHEHKIKLIQENIERLHVSKVVEPLKMDARTVSQHFPSATFDRILVDAPCSGLGLIRRKPDIRYQKTEEDIKNLPKIQLEILESASQTLKQWGIMVYSTCTIIEEENQAVVSAFLSRHSDFKKIEFKGNKALEVAIHDQMLSLYPHQLMTDGFFICCMQKVC